MATVTLEDVAARAGVSRSLVSLALKGSTRVSAGTRERIVAAAKELGYRPNLNARRLASHRTNTLGVMLADLHNPVFAEVLDGFDENEKKHPQPHQLLLAAGFRDPERERLGLESLIAQQVDGILLMGPLSSGARIQEFATQVPLVVIGRKVPSVDSVLVDDALGLRLAVEHLLALGHRRIAHIDGGRGAGSATRRRSFQTVMNEHGLHSQMRLVGGDYSEDGGRKATLELLKSGDRPSGIVAANDLSAIGVLAAARTAGLRVPEDLSVVGYDNTALAHNGYVDMTTVDYPRARIGSIAWDLISARITPTSTRPGRTVTVDPALIVRSTTAAPAR